MQHDAFTGDAFANHGNGIRVVLAHDRHGLDQRDRSAKTAMSLCQLDADGATADDEQVVRAVREVEDRLVGEVRNFRKARYGRHERRGPRCDDIAPRLDTKAARLDFVPAVKLGRSLDHVNAQALEPFHGVMWGDGADDVMHVLVDPCEVDLRFVPVHAEGPGRADGLRGLARRDQGL